MKKEIFCRTEKLLGAAAMEKLEKCAVLLLGVGGVGGYAAEFLVRSGIGHITFVDGDVVEESNCNRQIVALVSTLGKNKAAVMAERAGKINPQGVFTAVPRRIPAGGAAALFDRAWDLVVDCIDDTQVKVEVIEEALKRDIPVVSSMGAAGKLDPTKIERADISATKNCPLARAVRRRLKERGIRSGVSAVFSAEKSVPRTPGDASLPGTCAAVVAAFGAAVAAEALKLLLEES
ncbi:MAG: tRNA threonylcarbamoyladenosine dehydratase [Victivallaceae bacterium]|nr:tRNA threonylcarbamoyladenosine dehydratase [Victivallaceae bacterium]